ncbi:phosphoribosylanthranilate isomerase [Halopseudomonas pelagia]|uniref:phosphoribosylanthranilate isomerase n=1 Tax=Halopseudomonas pelagia TaxID=553151 RepID=UPI00039FA88D|nr:phosphoribosylanthranilate isomerase [Halopseudomonas pelagia]|tara:strand:+ start:569 stop:1183 length:615 start_codon:yes stop_codon:yes gene_type:complete
MVRIKICGITRVEDALAAAQAGADAIGLVFYAPSPRAVSPATARQILRALPPFVTSVGLFVNASAQEINAVLAEVPLDVLQFHGDEPAAFCDQFNRPYLKALRVQAGDDLNTLAGRWPDASGILLDSYKAGVPGGTGEIFDWSLIPSARTWPLILAGGLSAENVAEAISNTLPWAVDVSGGVEQAKGVKDVVKINSFIQEVKRV